MAVIDPLQEEFSNPGKAASRIKKEITSEGEDGIDNVGKTGNFSLVAECLSWKIKTEEIDVEKDDELTGECISTIFNSSLQNNTKLLEAGIKKSSEENIKVACSLVRNCSISNEEPIEKEEKPPSIIKLAGQNVEKNSAGCDVKLHTEEDIKGDFETNIGETVETDRDETAWIPVDYAAVENEEISGHGEMVFQSAAFTEQIAQGHGNNIDSKAYVFSSNTTAVFVKDENSSIASNSDGSNKAGVYYDSNRIKLVPVSVLVKDLFLEISKHGSYKRVRKHINSKRCRCIFCTRKFKLQKKTKINKTTLNSSNDILYNNEISGESAENKWNLCSVCPARFKFLFGLRRHSAMNHRMHLCSECPSQFQLESDLRNHLKTHPARKLHVCAFCPFKGRVEAELEIHARIHATEKFFSCAQCHAEFFEIYNLLNHLQVHASTNISIKFGNESNLSSSKESAANNTLSILKLESSIQSYSYKQSPSLNPSIAKFNRIHYLSNTITNINPKSFSRDVSFFGLVNGAAVKHQLSLTNHVGSKFGSSLCNEEFKPQNASIDLTRKNTSNEVTELNNYVGGNSSELTKKTWKPCVFCPARFRFQISLTRHCAINHRVFICSECPAKFKLESVLQTHLKMHPVKKQFDCMFCSFKGRVEIELEIHAGSHSKEKLFSCAHCLMEFEKCYSLLDHIQTHTRGERTAELNFNGNPVLNDTLASESVPLAELNKEGDNAEEKEIAIDLVDTHSGIAFENETSSGNGVKTSSLVANFKEASTNRKNESDFEAIMLSSDAAFAHVKAKSKRETYFESNGIKLVDVSVVLKDLFARIAKNGSQRHVNSNFCQCVFCTRKFKLHSRAINTLKKEVKKNPKHCKKQVSKSVSTKWNSCTSCPARFRFMHHLKRHSAVNHRAYVCQECSSEFQQESDLQIHLKSHPAEKTYFCAICSFKCMVEVEMLMHAKIHTTEKLFSCAQCFKNFNRIEDLLNHVSKHTSTEKPVEFPNKIIFSKDSVLDLSRKPGSNSTGSEFNIIPQVKSDLASNTSARYYVSNHPVLKSMSSVVEYHHPVHFSKCLPSNAQSFGAEKMSNKLNPISESPMERHSSTDISKSLPSASDLWHSTSVKMVTKHKSQLSVHLNNLQYASSAPKIKQEFRPSTVAESCKKRFSCATCDMAFKYKGNLKQHIMRIHSNERPFACASCTATFKSKSEVKSHLAVHSTWRPFSCQHCNANFKTKGKLQRHHAVHLNEKPFCCTLCSARFKTKDGIRTHLQLHTTKKEFACQHCSAKFQTRSQCQVHSETHLSVKLFSCSNCAAAFKTNRKLQRHIVSHSSERPFACSCCDKTFKSKSRLIRHAAVHLTERCFSCSICAATFKTKRDIATHIAIHSTERPYACQHCTKTFKTRMCLNSHLLVHSDAKPFACTKCPARFKTKKCVRVHSLIHSDARPFPCPHCSSSFKMVSQRNYHISRVHLNKRPFSCPKCTATFKTGYEAKVHLASIHTAERLHPCPHCAKTFKTRTHLKQHLPTHSTEKLFSCRLCTATFKDNRSLTSHLISHSVKKEFSCEQCNASFKTRQILKQHLFVHSDERPFACPHCTATFKSKRMLKQHSATHSTEREFSCNLCTASFKAKRVLRSHMLTHSTDRPFKCTVCNDTFKSKATLKTHSNVHSDVKPFTCVHCSAAFNNNSSLHYHLFKVHSYIKKVRSAEKQFSCEHCNSMFKSKSLLKVHLIVHATKRPFLCKLCSATFKTQIALKSHAIVHSNERPFSCDKCSATYKTKMSLRDHLPVHSDEKLYKCSCCPATFQLRHGLKAHSALHSNSDYFS